MKIHNGMRPQDIVILLKIILMEGKAWQYRDLSADLLIAVSEISGSISRSSASGLINSHTRQVNRLSFMEFIEFGLKYVFPAQAGRLVTGIPTAQSHDFYKERFSSDFLYVWPDPEGNTRGLSIEPLHVNVPKAAAKDADLYKLLAGIDILRVGKVREVALALKELKKIILEPQRKHNKN